MTKFCYKNLNELHIQTWIFKLDFLKNLPYASHHKPFLITRRSWIQAIHKDRIFWKNLLKNKEMVFENGVKSIQAVAYNGVHTVFSIRYPSWMDPILTVFSWWGVLCPLAKILCCCNLPVRLRRNVIVHTVFHSFLKWEF